MSPLCVSLVVSCVALACTESEQRPLANPDYFQLRWVRGEPVADGPEYSDPANPGAQLQLHDEVLLDLSHVRSAKRFERDGSQRWHVSVQLTDAGTELWRQLTGDNIGRRVHPVAAGRTGAHAH
jgi:preprotein translocase subunit SecD